MPSLGKWLRARTVKRRMNLWHNISPRLERFVYKYARNDPDSVQSIDRVRDVIVKSRLWLSSPTDFNDPFDCKVHVVNAANVKERRGKIERMLKSFRQDLGGTKRRLEIDRLMAMGPDSWFSSGKQAIENQLNSLGVTCLSKDPRNLLMWSHYSQEHKGICYQFEVCKSLEVLGRSVPVNYTAAYPTIDFFTYVPTDLMNIVSSKFGDWQYEKELRIVAPGGAHKHLNFDSIALTGIVLGSKVTAQVTDVVKTLVEERAKLGLPILKIYRSNQHSSAYALKIYQ